MYTSHINAVDIEVTDRCNAECPVCPRSQAGGEIMPYVKNQELDLDYFKLIGKNFLAHITKWNFCGTKGDPASAQELFEILEYILECNSRTEIRVRTNGGARNSKFWTRLGNLFKDKDCMVVWSVDGWEDTNHIYRKNVKWEKLYENMRSYISTGANSMWEFNRFDHNHKDIPTVQAFCNRHNIFLDIRDPYGFQKIEVDSMHEKINDAQDRKEIKSTTLIKPIPVYNKTGDGDSSIFAYSIKPYGVPQENLLDEHQYSQKVSEYKPGVYDKRHWENIKQDQIKYRVKCKATDEKQQIYIDSNGMIMPCCYTASKYQMGDEQCIEMFEPIKEKLFVTESNTIYDVLDTVLYTTTMPAGINGTMNDKVGYCITCVQHCRYGLSIHDD